MPDDFLQYERFFEQALRDVVRKALAAVAESGLPGDHYFHVTFRTDFPGVEMSAVLRAQHPTEMPIILQNAFWDLDVEDDRFSVDLSFNQVRQRITIPFEAITVFQDPSVGFQLQFQAKEGAEDEPLASQENDSGEDSELKAEGIAENTGNVVTLDAFRDK